MDIIILVAVIIGYAYTERNLGIIAKNQADIEKITLEILDILKEAK